MYAQRGMFVRSEDGVLGEWPLSFSQLLSLTVTLATLLVMGTCDITTIRLLPALIYTAAPCHAREHKTLHCALGPESVHH